MKGPKTLPVKREVIAATGTPGLGTVAAFLIRCVVLSVLVPAIAGGATEQGIRGRASLAGEVDAGVVVTAYPYRSASFGPLTGEAPAASTATATDGTYALQVPPGRYVVEALRKAPGNASLRPEAGDLHCLYSGSPVTVAAGNWTPVGLNLVVVLGEQRTREGPTQLTGRITHKGQLQDKVYLYLYQDAASGFRGPARLLQPVASGEFRVRVPPGTYQLVARKRVRGGAYGPIEIGDLFNFYPMNPVTLAEGEQVAVEIPLVERLSLLEEDPRSFAGLKIRVLGPDRAPAVGHY
ncbi:MAG TPA: hypothetical protein VK997_07155, partial [Deferrisomatales bacterium]|nr:hypothetical protein [Deferrisomatales bacterium]